MRMWMVAPIIMCDRHLYGEHVELHMFLGTFRKHKNVKGYIDNNLLEFKSIVKRHNVLVYEMKRRMIQNGKKSNHSSFLNEIMVNEFAHSYNDITDIEVNRLKSSLDLFRRCPICRKRKEKANLLNIDILDAFLKYDKDF